METTEKRKGNNPYGRPKTPEYRKKLHRYSRFEDALNNVVREFESDRDKELVLKVLREIRG
ncbi:hypothetical protein OCD85_27655 [Bacillus pacificus]|uniref:hypothetical protein n=1 Tax=Bacillus cereus group TaxID=86661 RepID=UPI0021CDCCC2|nr:MULTISPECIES: hypothetical protein [Bacillus cereus group]MCU5364685.1 hypothetical protein [Bacillus pacificus]MCU5402954.1 hypothetical protein [Bacillus pacificus]HDR7743927.1 hypothetical protein [Bacillus pacificus]